MLKNSEIANQTAKGANSHEPSKLNALFEIHKAFKILFPEGERTLRRRGHR
jgi:hypothetical protein